MLLLNRPHRAASSLGNQLADHGASRPLIEGSQGGEFLVLGRRHPDGQYDRRRALPFLCHEASV